MRRIYSSFSALFVGRVLGAKEWLKLLAIKSNVSVPYSLGAFLGLHELMNVSSRISVVSVPYSLGAFLGQNGHTLRRYALCCFSALFVGRVLGARKITA